ncbi:MAG: ATP-binding protein [Bacteroidia bacterium]
MRLTLKTKIWMTVLTIVMMFAFFILFYFPAQQEKYLLKNYNKEVQNLANTVALGVKIAITEQNFEGVQTALDFVKDDPHLLFVSMVQTDTAWNEAHTQFTFRKSVFKTYPDSVKVDVEMSSGDFIIIKRAPFNTQMMNGEIMLGFTTDEIIASKEQIRNTSLIVSAIVFIIGIIIGFWLARNISVPVLALRDAANRVGEGDLTQRVVNKSQDEIGELGKAFNKMVDDLAKAQDEINRANINLGKTNEELHQTVENLKATQEQLVQSEKMASLGQLTAGIAHEIQNPLNFVNNFSELSVELIGEMKVLTDEEDKAQLMESIKTNLEKIVQHGKRADRIVKGMLLHSREQKGEKVPVLINQMIDEDAVIAYHGMRAKNAGFQCVINKEFDQNIIKVNIVPQDINRVFINLLNNAFYAVKERSMNPGKDVETGNQNLSEYKPEVSFATSLKNGMVNISIKDNGTGIPAEIKDKIFNPFFTTKPAGQGTGLGLSLSYDIIKAHGGEIKVESQQNEFTEFTITLPVS